MNEMDKNDAGATPGTGANPPMAGGLPQKPAGASAAHASPTPHLPEVPIGVAGYKFKFPVDSPQGQDERREHERLRKQNRRAAARPAEPPPLPAPSVVDSPPPPPGEQDSVVAGPVGPVVPEFVPWLAKDVSDFTDELVELAEVKRVSEFVQIAREAGMPPKFIAEVEKRSHYPTNSKSQLKRCLAECAAKWLNKTGVSSANKEEVKLLFCMVTIKLQGLRLKKDLVELIEADKTKSSKTAGEPTKPALAIVK